ncbi:MAG: ROK family protein [Acidimicrobiaceae bacterium]|nr:ROK family protein [Acidimicrobiaceae bacterium]
MARSTSGDESACLAIDIGGTKIAVGLVSLGGQIVESCQIATPATSDPEEVFGALLGLITQVESDRFVVTGVGCGGPMDQETVSPLNIPAWRYFPLASRLKAELAVEVFIENDAKALAIGEARFGHGIGLDDFVAMVVSTGVGGGIYSGGRLLNGKSGNAGHIGHIQVYPDGNPCPCGGRGCLEAHASGLAIERMSNRPASEATEDIKHEVALALGRGIASVASLLDVEDFFLSGSVALGFGQQFLDEVQEVARSTHKIAFANSISVKATLHGSNSPLLGAAALGFLRAGL